MCRIGERHRERLGRKREDLIVTIPDRYPADHADYKGLGERHAELDRPVDRKHLAEAGDRIEPAEVGLERLGRHMPAAQRERRQQRREAGHGEDRYQHIEAFTARGACANQHPARFEDARVIEHQGAAQHRPQMIANRTRHGPDAIEAGRQQGERRQLPRTYDLPLFPRLFEAPGSGGFGFFEVAIPCHAALQSVKAPCLFLVRAIIHGELKP